MFREQFIMLAVAVEVQMYHAQTQLVLAAMAAAEQAEMV
jgi:hypothetical protein